MKKRYLVRDEVNGNVSDLPIEEIIDDSKISANSTWSSQMIKDEYDNVYSMDEHVVGYWIDGKPLYRKVINFGTPISGEVTLAHGISDIDTCVSFDMYGVSESGAVHKSRFEFNSDGSQVDKNYLVSLYAFGHTTISCYIGSTFASGGSYAFDHMRAILEYTKTTD